MQKYLILFITISFAACINNAETSRYTKEQIDSLQLDSTINLPIGVDSVEHIDLNPFLTKKDFDFGSLISDLKLVPLETTDESLLDVIYKVLVTDSNIYILDRLRGGGVAIFDGEGKFIKRIPYGQGPGEIDRLYDISFDWENRKLVLFKHSFLMFFTTGGEFIEQKKLPYAFYNFTVIPEGYVFKSLDSQGNEHLGALKNNTLLITDKDFKLKFAGLPVAEDEINYQGYNYLYNSNSTLKITQKFVDTIYRYSSGTNRLYAKYVFNYDDKKLPSEYLRGSVLKFEKGIQQNDYYFHLGEYLESGQHNVFFLKNDHIGQKTIIYRNKRSKNLIGGTRAVFDDVKEIPTMSFPVASKGDYFISIHQPNKNESLLSKSSVLSAESKKMLSRLSEDDNPVLVLYKLKDF